MSELQQERRGIHQDPELQTPLVANFILPLESSNLNDQCQTCSKNIRSCVKTAWAASEIDNTFSRMKLRHIQRILDEYRLRLDIWMSDCGVERGDLPNVTAGDGSAIPTLLVELFQQLYQYSTVIFRGIKTIEAHSRTLIESTISQTSPVEVMNKAEVEILEACDSLASTLTELARLQSSIQMNSAVRLGSRSSGPEARLHTEVLNVRTAFLGQNADNLEYPLDSAMTEDTASQHSDDGMCPNCHLSFARHALHLHTDFCRNPTEFESIPQPSIQNPPSLHSPKGLRSSARNPFRLLQLVLGFVFHLRSLLVKIILPLGHEARPSGGGHFNLNQPFGIKPFANIPSDLSRNPFRLLQLDLGFVFHLRRLLVKIILPLGPVISGPLDELYPSSQNITDLTLHFILLYTQLILLFSLPTLAVLFLLVPGVVPIINLVTFWVATWIVMRLLNGAPTTQCLVGLPYALEPVNDEHELWFFINGVATGKNWLQSNLDLIAQTFQREVVGIHNTTYGFIFDLLECLIQRDLDYKSHNIRQGRAQIRAALAAPATKKLVLILHSQGGIEGSSILDWLLADLSHEIISKLEIFTFGNAARHFNNPLVSKASPGPSVDESKGERVIKHIEHYANTGDFLAQFGVLNFTSPQGQPFADGNAFFGTVFTRDGTGHLLNMHYLDNMFTMVMGKVDERGNAFMNSVVPSRNSRDEAQNPNQQQLMIKDVSRLWQYINGRKPQDETWLPPARPTR